MRVLAGTGVRNVTGRVGIVAAHHIDGRAIIVRFPAGGRLVCEPRDVEIDRGAPEYIPSSDAQPCRVGVAP